MPPRSGKFWLPVAPPQAGVAPPLSLLKTKSVSDHASFGEKGC